MAMVDVDNSSQQLLAWSAGRQRLRAALHSSDEPGELWK